MLPACARIASLYGDVAWKKRLLSHRAQITRGRVTARRVQLARVGGIFGVDRVVTSRERYQNSATATKSKVVTDIVFCFSPA